ncbi:hypothetical protein M378DRAFT_323567 [Amanita muscaria Koide BX008]|uniref:Uncharacterized protein n=1 Tax=Amanita muscaria (strain Koide BX008) TaxID=946122 RepID=A0A0C2XDW3_AMAMK|nr:hypothetical protein M378DRAFT_323567 [Amanita muscaria Koide BX008]
MPGFDGPEELEALSHLAAGCHNQPLSQLSLFTIAHIIGSSNVHVQKPLATLHVEHINYILVSELFPGLPYRSSKIVIMNLKNTVESDKLSSYRPFDNELQITSS